MKIAIMAVFFFPLLLVLAFYSSVSFSGTLDAVRLQLYVIELGECTAQASINKSCSLYYYFSITADYRCYYTQPREE